MDNQALQDAYKLFTGGGYNGSIEDFYSLISTNPEALKDSYSLFTKGGYTGSIDDYAPLIGVKKKSTSDSSETVEAVDAISAIGSSDSEEVVEGREVEAPQASYVVDGQEVDKQTIMSIISDPNKIAEAQEIKITNDDHLNTILTIPLKTHGKFYGKKRQD